MRPDSLQCPACGTVVRDNNAKYCPKCLVVINKSLVEKQNDSIKGYVGNGVDQNHLQKAISSFFLNNEELLAAFCGSDPGLSFFNQYLLITDKRVIFWKRGFQEVNKIFQYSDISGVGQLKDHTFTGTGSVELNIKGAKEIFPYIPKHETPIAVNFILDQMEKAKNKQLTGTVGVVSIPDQIKKLAELRDIGALTEEEFTSKKTELLKKM